MITTSSFEEELDLRASLDGGRALRAVSDVVRLGNRNDVLGFSGRSRGGTAGAFAGSRCVSCPALAGGSGGGVAVVPVATP